VIAASPLVGELIEMTVTPELAGLGELYERHHEAVFHAALRITGNPADAEDVLQTVFLRLLSRPALAEASSGAAGPRQPEHGSSAERPAAYFRRAAVNAAVDLLRRRAMHAATTYHDEASHAAVESAPLLKEQLRRAITTLDPDDASLFLLRYVEGLSNQELADLFELEKNNVAVRLHRIRLRLQAEMNR
jgi:RNA polymerase sigma-70 factor (ECF subfamily)